MSNILLFNNNKDWNKLENVTCYEEIDIENKGNTINDNILYLRKSYDNNDKYTVKYVTFKVLDDNLQSNTLLCQNLFDKKNLVEKNKKFIPKNLIYRNVYKKRYLVSHVKSMLNYYDILTLYKKRTYSAIYKVFFDDNLLNLIVEYL